MATAVQRSSAPTPATRSFGQLQREVARYVMLPDDVEALEIAGQGLNDAIRMINTWVWYWSLTYEDISFSVNTADYDINSDYKASLVLEFLDSSGNPGGNLEYLDPKRFFERYPRSLAPAWPVAYSVLNHVDNSTLSLNDLCPADFIQNYPTMRHRYYRRLQTMTSAGDTVIAPSEVEVYMLWYAKEQVASVFDPGRQALAAQRRAADALEKLKADDNWHHFHSER